VLDRKLGWKGGIEEVDEDVDVVDDETEFVFMAVEKSWWFLEKKFLY